MGLLCSTPVLLGDEDVELFLGPLLGPNGKLFQASDAAENGVGIVVTEPEGRRISFREATGRCFGKIVSILVLFFGFILAGLIAKKRALHNRVAGCLILVRK